MQDSKNLILAIVLCLVILFGWGRLAEYMGWVQTPDPAAVAQQQDAVRQEAVKAEQRKEEAAKAATLPVFTPAPGRDLTVDSPLYEAVFYTGGGPLRSFKLKKFQTGLAPDSPLVNMVDERTAAVAPLGLVINSQPSWSTGPVVAGQRRAEPEAGRRSAGRVAPCGRGGQPARGPRTDLHADSY